MAKRWWFSESHTLSVCFLAYTVADQNTGFEIFTDLDSALQWRNAGDFVSPTFSLSAFSLSFLSQSKLQIFLKIYGLFISIIIIYFSVPFQRFLNEYYCSFALDAVLGREIGVEELSWWITFRLLLSKYESWWCCYCCCCDLFHCLGFSSFLMFWTLKLQSTFSISCFGELLVCGGGVARSLAIFGWKRVCCGQIWKARYVAWWMEVPPRFGFLLQVSISPFNYKVKE